MARRPFRRHRKTIDLIAEQVALPVERIQKAGRGFAMVKNIPTALLDRTLARAQLHQLGVDPG
ncbi:MAG: hypothetical protein ACOC20_00945 [Oceanicaulis sp.]